MNDHDRKVADHYFKNSLMERFPDNFGEIDDLTSYFTLMYGLPGFIGVLTMAEHNNNEPIYSYIYSHRGSFSLTDLIGLSIWEMIFKVQLSFKRNTVVFFHEIFSHLFRISVYRSIFRLSLEQLKQRGLSLRRSVPTIPWSFHSIRISAKEIGPQNITIAHQSLD